MHKVIGCCGNCSGQVTVPQFWMGTVPPVPRCVSCGAEAIEGPILPMKDSPVQASHKQIDPMYLSGFNAPDAPKPNWAPPMRQHIPGFFRNQ